MRRWFEPWEWLILAALAAWGAVPIVELLIDAPSGARLTGADGYFAGDQLQYLSWIREAGEGLLAGNGFDFARGGDAFIHPMFTTSGLLWRAGLGLQASLLIWKPVAVVVLFIGFAAYVRRFVSPGPGRPVALALALFFATPLLASDGLSSALVGSTDPATAIGGATELWGYLPTAMSIGLMPVFLILLVRILDAGEAGAASAKTVFAAAVAGGAVSWLHPWQGETLLVIGLVVIASVRPSRGVLLRSGASVLGVASPLIYYYVLSRVDDGWGLAYDSNIVPGAALWSVLVAMLPLLVCAAAGVRRDDLRDDIGLRAVAVWPPAAVIVFLTSPTIPNHALSGLSLPLAVLAVRGWRRLLPRAPAFVAAGVVALAIAPGLIGIARSYRDLVFSRLQPHFLTRDEARALDYLDSSPRPGGVMGSYRLAPAVPAFTGRRVWSGHPSWTHAYQWRSQQLLALFGGQLRGDVARRLIRSSGAAYLVGDCTGPRDISAGVGAGLLRARSFGCATVYTVRRGGGAPGP